MQVNYCPVCKSARGGICLLSNLRRTNGEADSRFSSRTGISPIDRAVEFKLLAIGDVVPSRATVNRNCFDSIGVCSRGVCIDFFCVDTSYGYTIKESG